MYVRTCKNCHNVITSVKAGTWTDSADLTMCGNSETAGSHIPVCIASLRELNDEACKRCNRHDCIGY